MVKFFAPVPKLLQPHRHTTQSAAYQAQQASLNLLRSEEHTSELQSQSNLVCRLLLEKNTSVSTSGSTWPTMASPDFCQSASPTSITKIIFRSVTFDAVVYPFQSMSVLALIISITLRR